MTPDRDLARINLTRYDPTRPAGHYESFFQRANHPTRPLAFWIRYTIFSPGGHPEQAIGELWAVAFDGETNRHVAVKREVPFGHCAFSRERFAVRVAEATLDGGRLAGAAAAGGHTIAWDLSYRGDAPPLFLLPPALYDRALPRAKSLVGLPLAAYDGTLTVDGTAIPIDGWIGSQNHNWGARHTDHYAWGQVAGFDTHPETFLEVATVRFKVGPVWTPFMTTLVLRHDGRDIALNGLGQAARAKGRFTYFNWRFHSAAAGIAVDGTIDAPREAFVGLRYSNPPGGEKHCLNSKIARCELRLADAARGTSTTLSTRHRAAFEIVTDDRGHGVPILA